MKKLDVLYIDAIAPLLIKLSYKTSQEAGCFRHLMLSRRGQNTYLQNQLRYDILDINTVVKYMCHKTSQDNDVKKKLEGKD